MLNILFLISCNKYNKQRSSNNVNRESLSSSVSHNDGVSTNINGPGKISRSNSSKKPMTNGSNIKQDDSIIGERKVNITYNEKADEQIISLVNILAEHNSNFTLAASDDLNDKIKNINEIIVENIQGQSNPELISYYFESCIAFLTLVNTEIYNKELLLNIYTVFFNISLEILSANTYAKVFNKGPNEVKTHLARGYYVFFFDVIYKFSGNLLTKFESALTYLKLEDDEETREDNEEIDRGMIDKLWNAIEDKFQYLNEREAGQYNSTIDKAHLDIGELYSGEYTTVKRSKSGEYTTVKRSKKAE